MNTLPDGTDLTTIVAAHAFVAMHRRWSEDCDRDPVAAAGSPLHQQLCEAADDLATIRPATLAGWTALAKAGAVWSASGVDDLALAVIANMAEG